MTGRTLESIPFESRDEHNRRLREENARLRRLLAAHRIPVPTAHEDVPALQNSLAVQAERKEKRARL